MAGRVSRAAAKFPRACDSDTVARNASEAPAEVSDGRPDQRDRVFRSAL
jgi:hypothetical protein